MRNMVFRTVPINQEKQKPLRPAEPACEGPRPLQDAEVGKLLRLYNNHEHAKEMLQRYVIASESLRRIYGGSISLMESSTGQVRVSVKLELPTNHTTIDEGLYNLVVGMGFDLTLRTLPLENGRTMSTYIIGERACEPFRIATKAEDLVRLASMLEDISADALPANVVSLDRARLSSRKNTGATSGPSAELAALGT